MAGAAFVFVISSLVGLALAGAAFVFVLVDAILVGLAFAAETFRALAFVVALAVVDRAGRFSSAEVALVGAALRVVVVSFLAVGFLAEVVTRSFGSGSPFEASFRLMRAGF